MSWLPSPETQAALLLCSPLGQREESAKPLSARQYTVLAAWLAEKSLRPVDLLDGESILDALPPGEFSGDAIKRLLARGAALGLMIERLASRGVWAISREDKEFPSRYLPYLQKAAPPVLFGLGEAKLLQRGGVAIVGSRHASDEDLEFARKLGEQCAAQGVCAVSGAAKGVDAVSMQAALEDGGRAVGVLAEGLARAGSGALSEAIMDGRRTMISPYDPEARWFPYTAMERNKLIYALSDAAVVVSSAEEQGGTWSGATEALKKQRVPVFVKASGEVAPGNHKLMQIGARAFPEEAWEDLSILFASAAAVAPLFEGLVSEATPIAQPVQPAIVVTVPAPDDDARILAALSSPLDAKELGKQLDIPAASVAQAGGGRRPCTQASEAGQVRGGIDNAVVVCRRLSTPRHPQ